MKDNWFDSHRQTDRHHAPQDGQQLSQDVQRLLTAVGVAAVGLFLASGVEPPFVAALLRELLVFASLGFVAAAVFRREDARAAQVTAWDQAALLLLISLIVGLFVDQAAVQQALVDRGLAEAPATTAPLAGN